MAVASNATPSSTHAAFEWLRSEQIDSLNITVEEYRHRVTGAQHYHLASEHDENVFVVALRTVPMDSTGVAHILEHTALCGSERFPVRDPFFMMIRRSLNTFMNAFTSSDWTAYPFASQNRKDFYNLMDVYLDAVFFSRLDELDFAQEGHRLEFADPEDSSSALTYKGVVFNEMKGAMSSITSILWQTLSTHLFPTTTYHYNSGGDPEAIPDLTYDDLKNFYRTHYHPSNAVFMTFGNLPVAEHHARIEERALQRFEHLDVHIAVSDEQRYGSPVEVEESYPIGEDEDPASKTHIVMGWLLGKSTDLQAQLEAQLLAEVLLADSASPLRHALETTDLGAAPSPMCGLEDSNREMTFLCGVEGSDPEHAEAVQALVLKVVQKVADEGVPGERVEAILHQLELSQREIGGDGFPYGLQLALRGLSTATHRGDPVALLNLDPALEQLRQSIADPDFIKSLARRLLLDNQHRVRLTLKPDATLSQRRDAEERSRLDAIAARLSDMERREIVEKAKQLLTRQQQEDDPSILPKVDLEDIPGYTPSPTARTVSGSLPVSCFDQPTNGLVYQQCLAELPVLTPEQLELLPLLCSMLTEVGLGDADYLAVQARQSSVTGGIHAALSYRGDVADLQRLGGHFVLSGKALARNGAALNELLFDTLTRARFDEHPRLREIHAQERAHKEMSVTGSGHVLAMTAATSALSRSAAIAHRLNGLAAIQRMKQVDQTLEESSALAALADQLAALYGLISELPRQFLLIGEQQPNDEGLELLRSTWESRGDASGAAFADSLDVAAPGQLWTTTTQVNFCARAYPTVGIAHPDAAALGVLGLVLRNGFLHTAIREQGGAYGGGAGHDADAGAFRFFSYRDPRLQETLADFDRSIDWVLSPDPEPRLVEEAIIMMIGALDKPASPSGEARKAFYNALYGRTPELRQTFRENVLGVTLADVQRVAQSYLTPDKASTAVVTSAAGAEHADALGLRVHAL